MFKNINKECSSCGKFFKQQYYFDEHSKKCNKKIVNDILKLYYVDFQSIGEITKKYNKTLIYSIIKNKRSKAEQNKISSKKYPRTVSEQTKEKIREKRLEYLKQHKFDNAWRRSNKSYIEELFEQIINNNNLFKKFDIVREYSFFPYYLDFAFVNIKLDIEIDGSQHWKNEKQKQSDIKRDEFLISKGWEVLRIPEFKLRLQFEEITKMVLIFLDDFELQPKIYNFNDAIEEYEKVRKIKKDNYKDNIEKNKQIRIKVKEEKIKLLKELDTSKRGWVKEACNKLNMSHTAIRRFLRLNLPELETYFKPRKSFKQKYLMKTWDEYYDAKSFSRIPSL